MATMMVHRNLELGRRTNVEERPQRPISFEGLLEGRDDTVSKEEKETCVLAADLFCVEEFKALLESGILR